MPTHVNDHKSHNTINFFDTGKETKNQQSWSIDNIKTFRIALRKNVIYIHTHTENKTHSRLNNHGIVLVGCHFIFIIQYFSIVF